MRISCVIVSYNNGKLLEKAVMGVVTQTRPVDEVIIADDASTDGSRQLIETMSHNYPIISPVFRDRNLGVSANRDLAIRNAMGDFVTWLDGDDCFLPTKMEAEAWALSHSRSDIAYSDVRIADRESNRPRTPAIAEFARLGPADRVRWLLDRKRQSPRSMLVSKDVHQRIGGYNHGLRTYEDWDYTLRLAAQPLSWIHSGTEGLVHHPGGGLSRQSQLAHMRDELRVLRLNREMIRRLTGTPSLSVAAGRLVAVRSKWWMINVYWRLRKKVDNPSHLGLRGRKD